MIIAAISEYFGSELPDVENQGSEQDKDKQDSAGNGWPLNTHLSQFKSVQSLDILGGHDVACPQNDFAFFDRFGHRFHAIAGQSLGLCCFLGVIKTIGFDQVASQGNHNLCLFVRKIQADRSRQSALDFD